MSEENNNEQRSTNGNGPKRPAPNSPRFRFNFYWLYAALIVILLITQLFSWGGAAEHKINVDSFERNMLATGAVEKIVVSNEVAHIYIKKDRLKDDSFKDVRFKAFGETENPGPHYYLNTEIGRAHV